MENKIKNYRSLIGIILVVALIICIPSLKSFAGDGQTYAPFSAEITVDYGTAKEDVITKLSRLSFGNDEVNDLVLNSDWESSSYTENTVGKYEFTASFYSATHDATYPAIATVTVDKEKTPSPTSVVDSNKSSVLNIPNNRILSKNNELTEGTKLGSLFPDKGFAKYIYADVLKKLNSSTVETRINALNEIGDLADNYELTDEDIRTIKVTRHISIDEGVPINDKYYSYFGIKSIEGIKYFENLQSISINQQSNYYNDVDGLKSIPEEITTLSNLSSLTLGYGDLTEIPVFMSAMTGLTSLNLQYNEINKGVENCYAISELNNLSLLGNEIPEIPTGISDLNNLTSLSFALNQIETLPEELFQMQNLIQLALANNKIENIDGIEKLNELRILTLANNRISDFSPLWNRNNFNRLQVAGQAKYADAITVSKGATEVSVDIKDYEYKYSSLNDANGGSVVAVYDKLEMRVLFDHYKYFPHYVEPSELTDYRDDATIVNRSSTTENTIFNLAINKEDQCAYLRMQAPNAVPEKDGNIEWTSFNNNDITYIIPIKYEDDIINNDDTDKVTTPPAVLGEDSNPTDDKDDSKSVLGEEAKTADTENFLPYYIVMLFAALGAMLITLRRMTRRQD